jgi:hypothetical protein
MPLTGDLPTVKKWKIITSLYSIFINKGKRWTFLIWYLKNRVGAPNKILWQEINFPS